MTPPSTLGDLLKPIQERAIRAHTEINSLCQDMTRFRMSIPVNHNEDSDIILQAPLDDIEKLIKCVEVLSETLEACLDNSARMRAEQEIIGIKVICAQSLAHAQSILRGSEQ